MSFSLRSALPPDLPIELIPLHPCDTSTHLLPRSSTSQPAILNKEESKVEKTKPPTITTYREMDYCYMLNKVLPIHIKAIGYTEVTSDFNARFSAKSRTYRYFFLHKNLNIQGRYVYIYTYTYTMHMCVYCSTLQLCYTYYSVLCILIL